MCLQIGPDAMRGIINSRQPWPWSDRCHKVWHNLDTQTSTNINDWERHSAWRSNTICAFTMHWCVFSCQCVFVFLYILLFWCCSVKAWQTWVSWAQSLTRQSLALNSNFCRFCLMGNAASRSSQGQPSPNCSALLGKGWQGWTAYCKESNSASIGLEVFAQDAQDSADDDGSLTGASLHLVGFCSSAQSSRDTIQPNQRFPSSP